MSTVLLLCITGKEVLKNKISLLTAIKESFRIGLEYVVAEIHVRWMRGNHNWGVFRKDRVLPSPSPTANLVGVLEGQWKGDRDRCIAQRFFYYSSFALKRRSNVSSKTLYKGNNKIPRSCLRRYRNKR